MIRYPFTAICGQEDFKLALTLCMIDPGLGGVLALGDKGTGKTTTVRGLSQLLQDIPFVNLPIGATEDRVLGTVKLDVLLNEKRLEIQAGLLAAAHQGILYIDEVNLLSDYLMDVLLDAAATGGYYLERDTVSQWMESRFCLVGTMNPEEGNLRPQLLDRFGLSVHISTPTDKALRMEIVERRVAFDTDAAGFVKRFKSEEELLAAKIIAAQTLLPSVKLLPEIYEVVAELCIQHQVEGMRADILLMKAARAYAAYHGQKKVTAADVDTVQGFVLSHRSRQGAASQRSSRESRPSGDGGKEDEPKKGRTN
ncbi:ATP-binding protein [Chitinophaga sancti]|uniref:AAA family ATPase n=1 Tax=Chitinophaga sancti TaxID=1004 RepID=A0A1K1NIC4_9BACT|nr:AAA family ATPase [Chitinophaga sancti]WQD63204.1 AAA family ATPase [Chitinophaga sancti]WQG91170.1 AAA family ATPase [Chitinophaga sancti]SFW35009.1 magnesium chelatase subunit D [Chitinophaga sancti]